jgi:hypothetical protein
MALQCLEATAAFQGRVKRLWNRGDPRRMKMGHPFLTMSTYCFLLECRNKGC